MPATLEKPKALCGRGEGHQIIAHYCTQKSDQVCFSYLALRWRVQLLNGTNYSLLVVTTNMWVVSTLHAIISAGVPKQRDVGRADQIRHRILGGRQTEICPGGFHGILVREALSHFYRS